MRTCPRTECVKTVSYTHLADVPAEAVAVDGDDDFHVAVLLALVGRRA